MKFKSLKNNMMIRKERSKLTEIKLINCKENYNPRKEKWKTWTRDFKTMIKT